MKDRLLRHSLRVGILSALVMAAGMTLSLQGCLPPPGRVIVQAPLPLLPAPPFLYVIPGTYAYYVTDVDVDFFFYQGFWYRPHLGRWYRASGYNGPWTYIITNRVPLVLREIPDTYRRVPPRSSRLRHNDVQNNWRNWERERYWDKHDDTKRERYDDQDRSRGGNHDKDRAKDRGRERYDYRDNKDKGWDRDKDRDKDKDRGRGRDYRDNSRTDPGPQRRPVMQELRQREKHPDQDRNGYRDNGRDSGAPQQEDRQGLNRDKDQNQGKEGERNVRQDQKQPSKPVRQVMQPQAQQQEKQQTPSKQKQTQKKDKGREKDKDENSAPSEDRDEDERDEREKRKGR